MGAKIKIMNIKDLITSNSNAVVNIVVSADDLKEFRLSIIEDVRTEIKNQVSRNDEKKSLTPKEVCQRLQITRSSLWRWEREKMLVPVRVGGKVRYRSSDIEKLLNGGN